MNAEQARHKLRVGATLARTGMLKPSRPDRIARSLLAVRRWGATPAAGYRRLERPLPNHTAIIDDRGTLTFREVHLRSNALAHGLARYGLGPGDSVAIMCRNHRGFVEATVACSKLGLGATYLNTAFGAGVAEVLRREQPAAAIYDQEFAELIHDGGPPKLFLAWCDQDFLRASAAEASLEELIARMPHDDLRPPARPGRVVILTSGTTGTPKGAARHHPDSVEPAAALFSKIPLRARERTMIAAPMFHSWGLAHFTLALPLSSTLVLRRRFDPEETLRAVSAHRAAALILVPVMLQRILELDRATLARYDTSALRIIATSGSALPGELATRRWKSSAPSSTTCTARRRSRGRRSPPPRTCARRPAPPADRRSARS